jgi:hypothetical protein
VLPSRKSAPFSIARTAPRELSEPCPARWARTAAPLGTLPSARSEVKRRMWRDRAWRGRAGKAFELGEPGVGDGATANSLAADRRGPPQDDQAVKTKLLPGSCLRILDQGLGPTRARSSRNRPLEPLCTRARLVQGWAGHPCHTRRIPLTSTGTPAPDVDALCFGHALGEFACCESSNGFLLSCRGATRGSSASRTSSWPQCRWDREWSVVGRCLRFVLKTNDPDSKGPATTSNSLWE